MLRLFFKEALLPDGWASDVGINVMDGTIVAIERGVPANDREHVGGIALPGMPNVHSHAFQRGLAGLTEVRAAGNDSFWTWRELAYRFLGTIAPGDVEALAAQAYMEMLESGFTGVGEFHYLHHDTDGRPYSNLAEMAERVVAAAAQTGIGLTLLPSLYSYGSFGGAPADEGQRRFLNNTGQFLRLVEASRDALRPLPDAALGIAPHSLRALTPEMLSDVVSAAPAGPIHIHAAEQTKEVDDCLKWSGCRPIEWLLRHVGPDERWCVIHATHMTENETRALAECGAVAGLCPITEANLGDGTFNGVAFRRDGGRFGIGSDSNVEITAPGELRQLEYSQRLAHQTRNAMSSRPGESTGRILYEASSSGGAQALGRPIGGLAPNLRADIITLNQERAELASVSGDRWIDQFVFVLGARAIGSVYVGGQKVVENGVHVRRAAITERFGRVFARLAAT